MARLTLDQIKMELSTKRWVLLSPKYQNLDSELEMLCPEGHKVFISLKKWRRKQECPTCKTNSYAAVEEVVSVQKKSGSYRILALDDSTTKTGWSVFDGAQLIGYGKIEMTQSTPLERISALKQWLLSMLLKWKPDEVIVEDIQQQNNVQLFKVLAQLQGVLLNVIYESKYSFDVIHVSSWRKHCNIKGKTRKELKKNAQAKIKLWYDVTVTEDEADAICLGKCAAERHVKNNDFCGWD